MLSRGKLSRKTLENGLTTRLRKLTNDEENKIKKKKLSKLKRNFTDHKNQFTYRELNGLYHEKNTEKFKKYINLWITKNSNENGNTTRMVNGFIKSNS
tara:strand:+ start:721 stop:1014 length:294 start_codon:yes stop_codon:yes gene_type:complete